MKDLNFPTLWQSWNGGHFNRSRDNVQYVTKKTDCPFVRHDTLLKNTGRHSPADDIFDWKVGVWGEKKITEMNSAGNTINWSDFGCGRWTISLITQNRDGLLEYMAKTAILSDGYSWLWLPECRKSWHKSVQSFGAATARYLYVPQGLTGDSANISTRRRSLCGLQRIYSENTYSPYTSLWAGDGCAGQRPRILLEFLRGLSFIRSNGKSMNWQGKGINSKPLIWDWTEMDPCHSLSCVWYSNGQWRKWIHWLRFTARFMGLFWMTLVKYIAQIH